MSEAETLRAVLEAVQLERDHLQGEVERLRESIAAVRKRAEAAEAKLAARARLTVAPPQASKP